MRDAFGGVFMMRLFLVFIVVYIGFGAVSFNYAKAFKVKNKIIDLVETSQLQPDDVGGFCDNKREVISQIVNRANYNNITCTVAKIKNADDENAIGRYDGCCLDGVVITKLPQLDDNREITTQTYIVRTYNSWNLGMFDSLVALFGGNRNEAYTTNGTWEISGEAKVVVRK